MAEHRSGGRGAVLYWIAWALLAIGVVTIGWAVFRSPEGLGI